MSAEYVQNSFELTLYKLGICSIFAWVFLSQYVTLTSYTKNTDFNSVRKREHHAHINTV